VRSTRRSQRPEYPTRICKPFESHEPRVATLEPYNCARYGSLSARPRSGSPRTVDVRNSRLSTSCRFQSTESAGRTHQILLVGYFLQPADIFPVKGFLDGDMRHGGRRCRAVPMLVTRRAPNHIARSNFDNRSPRTVSPQRRDDQSLSEGMRVPSRARTGFEGNAGARHRAGAGATFNMSMRTEPVKYSAVSR